MTHNGLYKWTFSIVSGNENWTIESNDRHSGRVHVLAFALSGGWKPPKWWQFWRWNETQLSQYADVLDEAKAKIAKAEKENAATKIPRDGEKS